MFRLLILIALSLTTVHAADSDGFVDMFNGKDFTGWENPYDWGKYEWKDNEIHLTTVKKKFFLVTEKKK